MTIVLDEFPNIRPTAEVDAAILPAPSTDTDAITMEAGTEPERPWRDAQGDFFAVTLSRGYVTVTWHLGSGAWCALAVELWEGCRFIECPWKLATVYKAV